jgi:putative NIF3 family GTP cyclohydrolase 1 type 2
VTIKIQDVINVLTAPRGPIVDSVDTLKFGKPLTDVKGIAVTFMATQHVLEQAHHLGANLVITHEGTFFTHHDHRESSNVQDLVYNAKRRFIEESDIAIYRFHDHWHQDQPDGIMEGLIDALGWQSYVTEHLPSATLALLPPMTLGQTAEYIKKQLGLSYIRTVGDLSLNCSRIGLLVGYRGGGQLAIPLLGQHNLDLIIYGEGPEWETPEYVRDAVYIGERRALIVLGHSESEQPGMKLLADRLRILFPLTPVHYLPVESVFRVI